MGPRVRFEVVARKATRSGVLGFLRMTCDCILGLDDEEHPRSQPRPYPASATGRDSAGLHGVRCWERRASQIRSTRGICITQYDELLAADAGEQPGLLGLVSDIDERCGQMLGEVLQAVGEAFVEDVTLRKGVGWRGQSYGPDRDSACALR